MLRKNANLPDEDHVMRYVGWNNLRRDGDDNDRVIGFLPEAFRRRPEEEVLSVNWLEFFPEPATRVRDCVWVLRKAMRARPKSAFAIGNVSKIKGTCYAHGAKIRILYEPEEGEPAHSAIRHLPRDDLMLLAALADDAFSEIVRNAEIPLQPED